MKALFNLKYLNKVFNSIFISFFCFYGVSFLVLDEQFRRLGISPEGAFGITGILLLSLGIVTFLYFKKTHFKESSPVQKQQSYFFYFLLLLYLVFLAFTIFWGRTEFERSSDSNFYHHQIIKSLLSFFYEFNLNIESSIYSETFPRVAESFTALFLIIFQKLTFLRAQFFCFLCLFSFAFFRFCKILEAKLTFVLFVFILSVPTIFLQLHTNYIDLFVVPIFLIGISFLITARSTYSFFIGILWLALLGGLKLPFFIVSFFIILVFGLYKIQHKKLKFTWRFIFLSSLCFALPLFPLLIGNLVKYGSPTAPYSFLFFDGKDVFTSNFFQNRPIEFKENMNIFSSSLLRFLYSHFYKGFEFFVHYDARLGGGGFLFLFLILSVVSIYIQKLLTLTKESLSSFHILIEKIEKTELFLILAVISLFIIPETYWFRYIILIFLFFSLILFFEIKKLPPRVKNVLLVFIFSMSFFQFSISKLRIMEHYNKFPQKFSEFLNLTLYSSQRINEEMLALQNYLKNSKKIALFMDLEKHSRRVGNYVSASPVFSSVE